MVNLERRRPILAMAVGNPAAEEWLRGEIGEQMEVSPTIPSDPDDLLALDIDVLLVARRATGSDVGILDFAGMLESAAAGGMDIIAIVGDLDEEGEKALDEARKGNAWATLTSDSEGVGGEEVLERVLAYADDWQQRKDALKQARSPAKGEPTKRRSPLFGGRPPVPENHLIGITSAGGCGGSMFAWNLATALAQQGEADVVLISAQDTTLSRWTNIQGTRLSVLKGQGEEHFGVKVGIATTCMTEEEWVLAARLSLSQRVIVDMTKMSEPPLERVKTLIHVRDCDPAHDIRPPRSHLIVINRVPEGLPIEPADILSSPPDLILTDDPVHQLTSVWTGRPLVLGREDLAQQLVSLVSGTR